MPIERTQSLDRRVPARPAGRLRSRAGQPRTEAGPAVVPRLGRSSGSSAPIAARYIEELRSDIEALREGAAAEVRLRARRRATSRSRSTCKVQPARQPVSTSATKCRAAFPLGAESGRAGSRSRRAAAASSSPTPIVEQPIAMRVIVNRVWKGHFGTGIVDTPSNFGMNGERPTHPELLEYLAQCFVDQRHVDQGAASRDHAERGLSARAPITQPAAFAKDSGNRLYWRANRRRMTAEQIRDSVLFVSGALDTQDGRAVGAADAARQPPHGLRPRQPLQARRVPAAVRLPEPEPVAPSSASRPTCRCSGCSS